MQFLLFLAVIVFFVSLWYTNKESLSTQTKLVMVGIVIALIGFAIWYEMDQNKINEDNRAIINAFKQGKTLSCGGVDVNATSFVFVNGTLSFIPSDTNGKDRGIVIDISTCKTEH